jgi:uncharacterized protein DUF3592
MRLYDYLHYRRTFSYYWRLGPIVGVIIGLGLCVSGCVLSVFVGLPAVLTGVESVDWPSTKGKVTLSRGTWTLERNPMTDRLTKYYRAELEYEYEVNGTKYQSTNIAMNSAQINYPSQGAAELVAKQYPRGATVTVYYNPDEPHVAVLKKGQSYMSIGPLLLGIPIIFLGLVVLVATTAIAFMMWRRRRK